MANKRAAARTLSAATPRVFSNASGEFSGLATKSRHATNESRSQRSFTKSFCTKSSVTTTCAIAEISATLVPGRKFKW